MSNTFGERFRVTTFGEAHGPAVGAVIDGCPAGLPLTVADLEPDLARDVPEEVIGTSRREPNRPEILSGVFEGLTLGTPILILIRNEDVCSRDYLARRNTPRPGHADLTWRHRYGHVDPRGGGRASGRECIARVAAGAVARRLLGTLGITVSSRILELGGVAIQSKEDLEGACEEVHRIGLLGDSTGGVVRVTAEGHVDSKLIRRIYETVDKFDDANGLTAMMRTTSYPTAIIGQMMADDVISERGVMTPEMCVDGGLLLDEMRKREINFSFSETEI